MDTISQSHLMNRHNLDINPKKAGGITYTPKQLSDFVAEQIIAKFNQASNRMIRILDPAVGDGELLISLLSRLKPQTHDYIQLYGFETNFEALTEAHSRLKREFPELSIYFENRNFLEYVLEIPEKFDCIIANPPYVRTQTMGAEQAKLLSRQFNLSGHIDLYHTFISAIGSVLKPKGITGIIVPNRFMTIKSGVSIRQLLERQFKVRHIWDLGDTKLFDAAVLPAVLLLEGKSSDEKTPTGYTSIYETSKKATKKVNDPISALKEEGVVQISDGRCFQVQHGILDQDTSPRGVWRISTEDTTAWLDIVKNNTWGTFRDIGKVRVGVKTCADKVFIRSDWDRMDITEQPELLKPIVTGHVARQFRPKDNNNRQILYPHTVVQGKRSAVDIAKYPRSRAYLQRYKSILEKRHYVLKAGRQWYEIWIQQDPQAWDKPKLVFRDISEKPTFWIDLHGSVVNGTCYWLIADTDEKEELLWLAVAVGNSTFIEKFYDICFINKLYAGRRRFITQYVEQFPLPDPKSKLGTQIIEKAKAIYECTPSQKATEMKNKLDEMVWKAFGLTIEEV